MRVLEATTGEESTQAALVIATGHDRATKQLLCVARKAAEKLDHAGYQVVSYYGEKATCAPIFVQLMELRQSGTSVSTGFLAAHGSDRGLHDHRGDILVDAAVCEQLPGAILVLAACLCGGELPKSCVKSNKGVEACIGFKGKLWTPRPRWWSKLLSPSSARKALDDFRQCILQPMCSLIGRRSVKNSTMDGKKMWRERARSLRSRDQRIALVFEVNRLNLDFWGKGSAKLRKLSCR